MTPTAAQDATIRTALAIWLADAARAALLPGQCAWLRHRLANHAPLTAEEKRRLTGPLVAYLQQYHPALVTRVAAQLQEERP